jgi:uncharacterized membrane protein
MLHPFIDVARAARRIGRTAATCTLIASSFLATGHASARPAQEPTSYCAYELGADLVVEAINNRNQLAGTAVRPGDLAQAFVWDARRGVRLLGVLPGAVISVGSDINDRGEVIGNSGPSGFVWDERNGMRPLDTLGGSGSTATHINNLGQIIGLATTPAEDGEHVYFRDVNGDVEDLGHGIPFGVNDFSQVGFSIQSQTSFDSDVFLWKPHKGVRLLRKFPEGMILPSALNNRRHIVGSQDIAGFAHAIRWTPGRGMEYLPELSGSVFSSATDENRRGTVVGYTDLGFVHPFIWRAKTGVRDLTTMIDPTSPSTLNQELIAARAINDLGWIAVNTSDRTGIGPRAYVLTPKFESDGSACLSSAPT